MGHEREETFTTTMFGQERLQALTVSYMRVSLLLGSSMDLGWDFEEDPN